MRVKSDTRSMHDNPGGLETVCKTVTGRFDSGIVLFGPVVKWLRHRPFKAGVMGSIPSWVTMV